MTPNSLFIYLHDSLAGHLWLDAQKYFTFRYDQTWLQTEDTIPISLSLPLKAQEYANDSARAFFANLLPEARIRTAITRNLGISVHNDFGLLSAIGGECAGAISVWPSEIPTLPPSSYRELTTTELAQLIETMPAHPILMAGEGARLSLAGAQNKLPVLSKDGKFFIPEGTAVSSHILKPQIRGLPCTVENETFCMMLAKEIGLPVPEVNITTAESSAVYVVDRYDREQNKLGKLTRIHQEDFCQAQGYLPTEKYEGEGGPSFAKCFALVASQSTTALGDQMSLLKWLIFNLAIGNTDAHAKNISILFQDGGVRLAPFYDLMCTNVYDGLTKSIAMKVGNAKTFAELTTADLTQLATETGIKTKILLNLCNSLSEELRTAVERLLPRFVGKYGAEEIIVKIRNVIAHNTHALTNIAK